MQESSHRTYKFFNTQLHKLGDWLRLISFPGFDKVPIYDVFTFFFKGLRKGSLNTRATSIAFNFLLALGPALIFLLSLITYIPVKDIRGEFMELLNDLFPTNSYIAIESLLDQLQNKKGGMQIFGFLVALFFAHKGLSGIIESFNATYHTLETRKWLQRILISAGLVIIIFILVTIAAFLLLFSKNSINRLVELEIIKIDFMYYLILIGKWIIIIGFTFFSISFLYFLAPARKTKWRFFSAGSTLATLLSIIASLGVSYFMNNFAQFNKFFGSIGALVAIMLWMNFNALTLLIGFELNASIYNARQNFTENNFNVEID